MGPYSNTTADAFDIPNATPRGSLGNVASTPGQESRVDKAWEQLRLQLTSLNHLVTMPAAEFDSWTKLEQGELLSKMS